MKFYITVIYFFVITNTFATNYYVDSSKGNDTNQGTSTDDAWKSIDKVNNCKLYPGDSVLFKRGEIFRGNIIPISGSILGSTTYSAYGVGNKPKIFGSIQKNSTLDWINLGGNIWQTLKQKNATLGEEILTDSGINNKQSFWHKYTNKSIAAQSDFVKVKKEDKFSSSKYRGKIICVNKGKDLSDIQLFTNVFNVKSLKGYKLTFKAKASQQFIIPFGSIKLKKIDTPYTIYTSDSKKIDITTSWKTYEIYYKSNSTASDACIDFCLGNTIPNGVIFYFDSISLKEVLGDPLLTIDVGNMIFNTEAFCGIKVKNESDLNAQGKFWYDQNNLSLKIYSVSNPATYYSNIEIAFTQHIINESNKSFITYQNLDLRYGGAHGIGGSNTNHINIKDVDMSYIGGGFLPGFGDGTVRYGNGVEFGSWANNNIVERCTFNQIYDAALTAQGDYVPGYEAYNIYFRNNIIQNCEYSYELWGRGPESYLHDIYFENNTCLFAGSGWGHVQRQDPNGTHLILWTFSAKSNNVYIRNNIFYESTNWGSRYDKLSELSKVVCDYNCWYKSKGPISKIGKSHFDFTTQWLEYKSASGQDAHSINADPLLNSDFTLSKNSPCIGSGVVTENVKEDFTKKSRVSIRKINIGAFE